MRTAISKLFRWQPNKETLLALVAGFVILGLSDAWIPLEPCPIIGIVIRDIGQIFLVGVLFPLAYLQGSGEDGVSSAFPKGKPRGHKKPFLSYPYG
jgi:hypothetical protein